MKATIRNAAFATLAGTLTLAQSASAAPDTITATYVFPYLTGVSFTFLGNAQGPNSALIKGTRQDLPPVAGVNADIPLVFDTYCVEIGENISSGPVYTHEVFPLLNSVTVGGGISGPVTFDAVRAAHMELLWGSYKPLVVDGTTSAAFQLAQWEIAFDDDLTLVQDNAYKLYADTASDPIAQQAESWLGAIKSGAATQKQSLYLLRNDGYQDLVTPVPEPATLGALGIGIAALLRRKAKRA